MTFLLLTKGGKSTALMVCECGLLMMCAGTLPRSAVSLTLPIFACTYGGDRARIFVFTWWEQSQHLPVFHYVMEMETAFTWCGQSQSLPVSSHNGDRASVCLCRYMAGTEPASACVVTWRGQSQRLPVSSHNGDRASICLCLHIMGTEPASACVFT